MQRNESLERYRSDHGYMANHYENITSNHYLLVKLKSI